MLGYYHTPLGVFINKIAQRLLEFPLDLGTQEGNKEKDEGNKNFKSPTKIVQN